METQQPIATAPVMTPDQLLQHWQGHRRLTRHVIEAFPEDRLFDFSIGGMRPFARLAGELLAMGAPMVRGVVTGRWDEYSAVELTTRDALLAAWDADTEEIDALWPEIAAERFQETVTAFGQYTGQVYDLLFYVIDNEIHHRGQGYVYLRALGIEPPPFYVRD